MIAEIGQTYVSRKTGLLYTVEGQVDRHTVRCLCQDGYRYTIPVDDLYDDGECEEFNG